MATKLKEGERVEKYRKICEIRSRRRIQTYREFFKKVLEEIEAVQPNALAGVRVARCFTQGVEIEPVGLNPKPTKKLVDNQVT